MFPCIKKEFYKNSTYGVPIINTISELKNLIIIAKCETIKKIVIFLRITCKILH